MLFSYHPDILQRFPNICGGVIEAQEVINSASPAELQGLFFAEQKAVLERIGQAPGGEANRISEFPTLAAWRQAFRIFGTDPTKYRSATEALLRRLTKKGDIPSINTLVDICNLVSIRYALPVAAFDLRAVQGSITVQFAKGTELFIPHDQPKGEVPAPGEVIFVDEAGSVHARRWCWKQSAESTVDLVTRRTLITVEAQHPGGQADVQVAVQDLLSLLRVYVGGDYESEVVLG